jgi:quinol monooxygenase YgiN
MAHAIIEVMHIVHVDIQVKPEALEAFVAATLTNARASRLEAGIAQFDLFHRQDESDRFLLVEAYRDEQAPLRHKETEHYRVWAETVAPMMARPRQALKYTDFSS